MFGFRERKALKCEGDYFELLLFLSSRYDTRVMEDNTERFLFYDFRVKEDGQVHRVLKVNKV